MAAQLNALDLSVDDFNLSRLFDEMDEDNDQNFPIPTSDVNYAQGLQLQEAVIASMMINKPQNSLVVVEEQVKVEVSESSLSFCEICVESKTNDRVFMVRNCSHVFCNDCVNKHVEAKLQSNAHTIMCPAVNCEEAIEFHSCNSIVPKDVLEKWDKLLCESSIQASQKFYCPFKDCSAMLLRDTDEFIREAECPSCFRLFCAQCSSPWHPSVDCEEFQGLDVNERANEDLMLKELAKEKSWNRCPRCRYYVEKTEGCIHMTCRCGFQFCYVCGATWTANHGGCQPQQQQL